MLHIGRHLSFAKGYYAMGKEALALKADTFAFFTRNPRGGRAKAIDASDVDAFLELVSAHGFAKLVAHAPYTMNPCAAKEELRVFARETMADDLKRMEFTPGNYYNFHPGSHVKQGVETGIDLIAAQLNAVLSALYGLLRVRNSFHLPAHSLSLHSPHITPICFQRLSTMPCRYCLYSSRTSSGQLIRIPLPIPASHPKDCVLTVTVTPAWKCS